MKPFLARQAYALLAFVGVIFLFIWVFWGFSWILFLLFLALCFIYKNKQISVFCTDEKAILSPVDGNIAKIQTVNHRDLGECVELSIENSFYNEGVIRACSKMTIKQIKFRHGLFFGTQDLANFNERVLILANSGKKNFGLRISAGFLDRKIKLNQNLSKLQAGDELGFSLNSTVSLFLPKDTRLLVGVGDRTNSCSLLGYFS